MHMHAVVSTHLHTHTHTIALTHTCTHPTTTHYNTIIKKIQKIIWNMIKYLFSLSVCQRPVTWGLCNTSGPSSRFSAILSLFPSTSSCCSTTPRAFPHSLLGGFPVLSTSWSNGRIPASWQWRHKPVEVRIQHNMASATSYRHNQITALSQVQHGRKVIQILREELLNSGTVCSNL